MTTTDDTNAARRGSGSNDLFGPLLEDAANDCLMALAGVDTYDVNLRDHPEAWKAIEAFAAVVQAAERERCAVLVETRDVSGHDGYIETSGDLLDAMAGCIRRGA